MTHDDTGLYLEALEGHNTIAGRVDFATRLARRLELIGRYEAGMEQVCSSRCARLALENDKLREQLNGR